MAVNAVALVPEVAYPLPNLNDDAEHVLYVLDAADAWARGENPFDFWVPQVEMGFPEFLYYQNLPHLFIVLLGRLCFGVVPLRTLFDLSRYALMVGFPLTVLWSMRRMGFSDAAAAIGASVSSLLAGDHRYGFEYDSYVWRGFGTYTQLWAMHLSFVALATLHRVSSRGTGTIAAVMACAALVLSHLIYAYITAITAVLVLAFGLTPANAVGRLGRFAIVGALTAALTSYQWLPFLTQSAYLHVTPFLERFKYDSFGAATILGWLATGDLLDHGRLPVLTALVGVGIVAAVVARTRLLLLTLGLFAVWLVLYFGRPTLGPLADLLPMHDALYFHRFSGPVDLFAILLCGAGGAWLWDLARTATSRPRLLAATAASLVLLVPVLAERWSYYALNTSWMQQTKAALDADTDARELFATLAQLPPGRVYAGLRSNWGQAVSFGIPFNSVRMYHLLVHNRLDGLAPPYRSVSFNADLAFLFNDQDLSHYRLFDVAYVVAPASVRLPAELRVVQRTGRYVLYASPASGYAEYVRIARVEAAADGADLFERELAWIRAGEPAQWSFARYEYPRAVPAAGAAPIAGCENGKIGYSRAQPSRFDIVASCPNDSAMVIKVSYHPNWRVSVDGREVETFMVSPSFLGFALAAGQHSIAAEYHSAPAKAPLLVFGALIAVATIGAGLRERLRAAAAQLRRWSQRSSVGRTMLHQSRTRLILE